MRMFARVVRYTLVDQMRQKSFYVLLGICLLLVLMLRGCYKGNYTVNGQQLDNASIAWTASRAAFHVIGYAGVLVGTLLAMGMLRRDRDQGSMVLFLARPVARWQYLLGRVGGVWMVAAGFMFVLHLAIYAISLLSTGGALPWLCAASVGCFVNLLLVVTMVTLLSLFIPEVMAALATLGVVAIGGALDGWFYTFMQSSIAKSAMAGAGEHPMPVWYLLWPKITAMQSFALSVTDKAGFHLTAGVLPVVNVVVWLGLALFLLWWRFERESVGGAE
jgi:ABC-type transport system involved in multi-copper enzyme maturation permease subunit